MRFWQAVEMFSPQRVEQPDQQRRVFRVEADAALPWDGEHELAGQRLARNQMWRHDVYLGIYRLDDVYGVLSQVLDPDLESHDERPGGESAVAAFTIDENGCAIGKSEILSSCAWATGAVRSVPGPEWIADFRDACLEFGRLWDKVTVAEQTGTVSAEAQQPGRRVLDHDGLDACLTAAVHAAGVDGVLPVAGIRIRSRIVSRQKPDGAGGTDFLNSFIMDDLGRVAAEVAAGASGTALNEYLRPQQRIPTGERIDVRDRIDVALERTAPREVPAGRWPGAPAHALALSQQLAVNTASAMTGTGIMGVNGPPGTGKTTMLRDIIAALVVERASRLAALPEPGSAFTGGALRWKVGDRTRVVRRLCAELTGFEMVVASSNNGAIENVTDEIPAADAISEHWRDAAAATNYFPEIATALLAPESPATPGTTATAGWALLTARLGNKTNRGRFVDRFWYHKPDDPEQPDWHGLLSILETYEADRPEQTWNEAVATFRAVEARVEALRCHRSDTYNRMTRQARLRHRLTELTAACARAAARVRAAREDHDAAQLAAHEATRQAHRIAQEQQANAERAARLRHADAERAVRDRSAEAGQIAAGPLAGAEEAVRWWSAALREHDERRESHSARRPRWWQQLWSLGAAGREWSRRDARLAEQAEPVSRAAAAARTDLQSVQDDLRLVREGVAAARTELNAATRALTAGIAAPVITYEPLVDAERRSTRCEAETAAAQRSHTEIEHELRRGQDELAAVNTALADAATGLGRHYPDDDWWSDRERRESHAPWTDTEWNTARSDLLLAALALHRSFLRQVPGPMRRNLQAAMDIVGGNAPRTIPPDAAQAAWQSLFLVVPVVSTTFASHARLFRHLEREALGWLLIDEAGQATPQNAVGALWRTQRAVVVGDPLQLEPVTTLPFRTEQTIRTAFGVEEQWTTGTTSVQRLADRLTPLGTSLPTDDGVDWVGIPLTVHRRCDNPMFGIVNTIAYDGLMIHGTGTAAQQHFDTTNPTLPASKWIDLAATDARGHWIPAEGVQLDQILDALDTRGIEMSEVMVISPFRDVARQIAARRRVYPDLTAGTIHTAQGKQADIVILVLGGNPERPGAKRWAADKPNLLNVAVSRAKRRLYVIGDHRAWSRQRYFDALAEHLPRTEPVRS